MICEVDRMQSRGRCPVGTCRGLLGDSWLAQSWDSEARGLVSAPAVRDRERMLYSRLHSTVSKWRCKLHLSRHQQPRNFLYLKDLWTIFKV